MGNPALQFINVKDMFSSVSWESFTVDRSGATFDLYEFTLADQLYVTIRVNYTDANKDTLSGATRTFA